MEPPARILTLFDVTPVALAGVTRIAAVWQVRRRDGTACALKVYHGGDEQDEGPGLDLLTRWDGRGAVRVVDRCPGAALMDWLAGPGLDDLARGGDMAQADAALVAVAQSLPRCTAVPGLPHVADWLRTLFDLTVTGGSGFQAEISACKDMARHLLATAQAPVALHGDLHHGNVRRGADGWRAFDAKGVLAEPAFEAANALRNPEGAPTAVRDPDRLRRAARLWAAATDVAPARILHWAAVRSALALAWDGDGPLNDHAEADLPGLFLHLALKAAPFGPRADF